jgi:hypothetical protein
MKEFRMKKKNEETDLVSKYMPTKAAKPKGILIQARIEPDLAEDLRAKLKQTRFSLLEWMEASARSFLAETAIFKLASEISASNTTAAMNAALLEIDTMLIKRGLSSTERSRFMSTRCQGLLGFTPFNAVILGKEEHVRLYIARSVGKKSA